MIINLDLVQFSLNLVINMKLTQIHIELCDNVGGSPVCPTWVYYSCAWIRWWGPYGTAIGGGWFILPILLSLTSFGAYNLRGEKRPYVSHHAINLYQLANKIPLLIGIGIELQMSAHFPTSLCLLYVTNNIYKLRTLCQIGQHTSPFQ